MPLRIVLSTIDSEDKGKFLATQLVYENLAACVTLMSSGISIYRWKGALEEARETLLIIKTAEDRLSELMNRLKELHPYEVPEMVVLPIDQAYQPYLDWVMENTRAGPRESP
jgi:periplasmic divalent cation tolerance protein